MSGAQPYCAEIVGSITKIPADQWDPCTFGNPFLKHAFLSALELSGCASAEAGWQPYHIQITNTADGSIAGFLPCYLKSHSYGEYVFDHAWAHAYEHAGGKYYPKLQSSVPFTPVTTPRLLTISPTSDSCKSALLNTLKAAVQQLAISTAHLTFLPEKEAQLATEAGYLVRTDQQFHWKNNGYRNFGAFLEALSSRKRKQIKKERSTALASGIIIEQLRGHEITPSHWDKFFAFYQDTSARKWGQPYLNRDFFARIHATMPDDILLFMCRRDGQYVAGALNFIGPDTLYGRYWGCTEDHPCLHFETCYYQAIDYAIAHGLSTVEAGAQGPHKLARGYTPVKTYSAHWIEEPGFRDAVDKFLHIERQDIDAEVEYLTSHTPFKKG
jgi:uncharacterized protein